MKGASYYESFCFWFRVFVKLLVSLFRRILLRRLQYRLPVSKRMTCRMR